jgi:hypothetical protein
MRKGKTGAAARTPWRAGPEVYGVVKAEVAQDCSVEMR